MSKIILDDDSTNLNPLRINENFRKIAKEFNEKVLYRDNPKGEPNEMENHLDMNGNRIYNLPRPIESHEPLRLIDIDIFPEEAKKYAEESENWANKSKNYYENTLEALSEGEVYIGDYAPGLVVNNYTEFFGKDGIWYRPSPDLELPYAITGDWETESLLFLSIGDTSLRKDLSDPDKGASLISRGVVSVNTYSELLEHPIRRGDLRYLVGGTSFIWSESSSEFIPEGVVNAKIFGFLPESSPEINSDAIELALSVCSGRSKLYIEPKEHILSRTIEIPSDTYMFSDGKENIVFKMSPSVRRGEMVIVTGHRGNHKSNIVLKGFGIDFNRNRWLIEDNASVYTEMTPSGEWFERNLSPLSQSALVICNSSNVTLEDLQVIDAYSHCIDITAPTDGRGQASAVLYDPEPSFNIYAFDILVSGHGDDGITTHQSYDIIIDNVMSDGASGVKIPTNANAVEIDDGSRHVYVDNIVGKRCSHALSIQGHADSPAPYSVHVGKVTAINCRRGVFVTHTGWASDSDPEGISGGDGSGKSPTARDVSIGEIVCIAPRFVEFDGIARASQGALGVSAYLNVAIGSIYCTDGSKYIANNIDGILPYTPTDQDISRLITTINGNVRGLSIENIFIEGFSDTEVGVFLAPRNGSAVVNNLVSRDGPLVVFDDRSVSTFDGAVTLNNYDIEGNQLGKGTAAIIHSRRMNSKIGTGVVKGYDIPVTDQSLTGGTYPYSIMNGSSDVRINSFGDMVRRSWVGDSVRHSEWITGNTLNIGSAGGTIAFFDTSGGEKNTDVSLMVSHSATVRPGRDAVMSLGQASNRWTQVYATSGTINTSDARSKQQISHINDKEKSVALKIKGLLRSFKFNDAVREKGEDGARIHFGVVAQDVADAFRSEGLDPNDYAMFCHDEWDEIVEKVSDSGEIVRERVDTKDIYGIRYDELLAFIISAI